MKNRKYIFAVLVFCTIIPVHSESLLKPTPFPKVFDDVDFSDQYAVLAEDYEEYNSVYDANGICISGCPYVGISIEETVLESILANEEAIKDLTKKYGYSLDPVTGTPNVTVADDDIPMGDPTGIHAAISNGYGKRINPFNKEQKEVEFHHGVDFPLDLNSNVYATANGVVQTVGENKYNGKYITLKHKDGYTSIYVHLNKQLVKVGDSVSKGTVIGKSGSTGRSTGPHLHYTIKKDGKYIDPALLIKYN